MKEKIKLSGVPETMLQTVYARAKESSGRGAIHDAKAEGIIEKLDYDFSLADKDTDGHFPQCQHTGQTGTAHGTAIGRIQSGDAAAFQIGDHLVHGLLD